MLLQVSDNIIQCINKTTSGAWRVGLSYPNTERDGAGRQHRDITDGTAEFRILEGLGVDCIIGSDSVAKMAAQVIHRDQIPPLPDGRLPNGNELRLRLKGETNTSRISTTSHLDWARDQGMLVMTRASADYGKEGRNGEMIVDIHLHVDASAPAPLPPPKGKPRLIRLQRGTSY